MTYDAVVLAGGRGRRLGGVHKPAIDVRGRTLIDIAVDAVSDAESIWAVGPPMPTARPVQWAREDPPGGGPVAAIGCALSRLTSPVVVVLAADLPFINSGAIDQLLAAKRNAGAVAALAIDEGGQDQPLLAGYDVAALATAIPTVATDVAMRSVIRALDGLGSIIRIDLGGQPAVTTDCDTAEDLARAQELV